MYPCGNWCSEYFSTCGVIAIPQNHVHKQLLTFLEGNKLMDGFYHKSIDSQQQHIPVSHYIITAAANLFGEFQDYLVQCTYSRGEGKTF